MKPDIEALTEMWRVLKNDQETNIQALSKEREALELEIQEKTDALTKVQKNIETRQSLLNRLVSGDTSIWEAMKGVMVPQQPITPGTKKHGQGLLGTAPDGRLATAKDIARMKLYKQGLTDTEVAEMEGLDRTRICVWRKRWNLRPNPPAPRESSFRLPKKAEVVIGDVFQSVLDWTPAKRLIKEVANTLGIAKTSADTYIRVWVKARPYIETRGDWRHGIEYRKVVQKDTPLIDDSDPIRMDHVARNDALRSAMT